MEPLAADTARKGLSVDGTRQVLLAYAATKAEWWLMPEHDNDGCGNDRCKRRAEVVIEEEGRFVASYPLGTKTYGSLVRTLTQQPNGNFAIPHLRGYQYDNYQLLPELKARAQELLDELEPEVNELLRRMYELDDTADVAMPAAEAWWKQADKVEDATKWHLLKGLLRTVGAPDFLKHSSQLQQLLPEARAGLRQISTFLAQVPLPAPTDAGATNEPRTLGDGSRFQLRHIVSGKINHSGRHFSSNFERNQHPGEYPPEDYAMNALPAAVEAPPGAEKVITRAAVKAELETIRRQIDALLAQL